MLLTTSSYMFRRRERFFGVTTVGPEMCRLLLTPNLFGQSSPNVSTPSPITRRERCSGYLVWGYTQTKSVSQDEVYWRCSSLIVITVLLTLWVGLSRVVEFIFRVSCEWKDELFVGFYSESTIVIISYLKLIT